MKSDSIVHLRTPKKLTGDIIASIEDISPKTASDWLRGNRLNRPVRRRHVAFLSREITEGLWQVNGQAIIIGENEDVIDGQHRLLAIIDSGLTIQSLVVYGVPKEAFKTIDTGAVRTGSDALSVWFPGRNTQTVHSVGGAVPWCLGLERGAIQAKEKVANAETIAYVTEHPSLWKRAETVLSYPKENRLMSLSLGTALYEMFGRRDNDLASEFIYDLYSAEAPKQNTPTRVLRNMLERDYSRATKYPMRVKARMAIKTWNLMRSSHDPIASPSMIAANPRDADRTVIT
jgi:hypothetical protein